MSYVPVVALSLLWPVPFPAAVVPSVSAHSLQHQNTAAFLALLTFVLSSQNFFFAPLLQSLISRGAVEFLQQRVDNNPKR